MSPATACRMIFSAPSSLRLRFAANCRTCRSRCFGLVLWQAPAYARLSAARKLSTPFLHALQLQPPGAGSERGPIR